MDTIVQPRGMTRKPRSSPLDTSQLHEAALKYLSRYASTEAGLRSVLNRKIDRWAKSQAEDQTAAEEASRSAVNEVIDRLLNAGLLSDADFAEMRVKNLARSGHSSRAIRARLLVKGIPPEIARAASILDPDAELASAIVAARRRRIGPYRSASSADEAARLRELARLARDGFSREVAERALNMSPDEADRRTKDLRR